MNADALTHLTNDTELQLVLARSENPNPKHAWYAAFREADADWMTPERGYGYGSTPDEAIEAAVASFRRNEDAAGG